MDRASDAIETTSYDKTDNDILQITPDVGILQIATSLGNPTAPYVNVLPFRNILSDCPSIQHKLNFYH